jgi:hypothetical protein
MRWCHRTRHWTCQHLVVHDCLARACDANVVAETIRDGRFVFGSNAGGEERCMSGRRAGWAAR